MTPEPSKAKSFADILQQNQEFIAHLQALQEDIGTQLEEKEKELAMVRRQLAAKQQETDELQNSQLQWAIDRQGLLTTRHRRGSWGRSVDSGADSDRQGRNVADVRHRE